ncbi:MAG: GNAT family N-acetyltransferase [Saprospiraceae bacterium]|nr:GNAT family N-acetyltransferase [Saprospiraceae bacterium]
MVHIKRVESKKELEGILQLQRKNIKENLTQTTMEKDGFVTLKHDFDLLDKMNAFEPHVIAVDNGKVIGYALVMVQQLKDEIPILIPMFDRLNEITYDGKIIGNSRFYIMGQVCIDSEYRGQGIFRKLYAKHRTDLMNDYDYCVTEVASRNTRSIVAHQKIGFHTIHSFTDEEDSWEIILLDFKKTIV